MNLRALGVMFCWFALSGCTSIFDAGSNVREKFSAGDAAQTRVFAASSRTAYHAARSAAQQMGYRVVRGGPAQGELDAITGVGPGERTGSSRQLAMKVRLRATGDGETEVTARFTEILETDSSNRAGHATETALRDTPQYQVFFRLLEQALIAGDAAGTIE